MKSIILGLALILAGLIYSCGKDDVPDEKVETFTKPEVESISPIDITTYYANTKGKVLKDGGLTITQKGICWSTDEAPDLDDNVVETDDASSEYVAEIYGLEPNKTYFARAFATNSEGTSYGAQISIKTPAYNTITTSDNRTLMIANGNELYNGYWADKNTMTGAFSKTNGRENTDKINTFSGVYAAKLCVTSNQLGKSDWYLPSLEELELIRNNREKYNITYGLFWSSTEDDMRTENAFLSDFTGGSTGGSQLKDKYKGQCRCVRIAD